MDKDPETETTINALAELHLDEATGEHVSKRELKKRMQKRSRKAAASERSKSDAKTASASRSSAEEPVDPDAIFKTGFLADLYKELPADHVVTRFPPEPNGYLHLGHAKAMAVNFGFARYHGGKTNLRFDDTNPANEKGEYTKCIEETVRWLGFTPDAITYTSDNFDRLYRLAEKLIGLERAYVCHCSAESLTAQRGGKDGSEGPRFRCEHANQTTVFNLREFRAMRDGSYAPGSAILRMKQDIANPNPQMWDLPAYRVISDENVHHRTGSKWKIYPTYDFAHCLCDSFEGITHSLCTREFVMSRESYEWLNSTLGVYEPKQREFGRLRLAGTLMSKRGLEELIRRKIIRGWDDPRIYTLVALRRRGIPAAAILSFINELGVTTAITTIQVARFEQSIRRYLESSVPRLMLVLDPLLVIIEDHVEENSRLVPYLPRAPGMGSYTIRLTSTIYIDRADFREVDSKDYFRLAPGKTVGLINAPSAIKATSFTKDPETGVITEVKAKFTHEGDEKPKAFIHWVPEHSRKVEARIYSRLFKSDDTKKAEGGYLNDVLPDSEAVYSSALISAGFDEVSQEAPWPKLESGQESKSCETIRFQALRVGYFAVDADSTTDRVVLNRIVSLKEDSAKEFA